MPLYCKFDSVRARVRGKVRFTEDFDDENKMHVSLGRSLINEAEAQVELDLSPRYAAPFQTDSGQPFDALPERPTKQTLRTLAELMSVMRILETDFGLGTAAAADKYYKNQKQRYDAIVEKLLKSVDDNMRDWLYPPMQGLRLAPHNAAADDGFAGQILTHSEMDGIGDYPAERINAPSETFWNATVKETEKLL